MKQIGWTNGMDVVDDPEEVMIQALYLYRHQQRQGRLPHHMDDWPFERAFEPKIWERTYTRIAGRVLIAVLGFELILIGLFKLASI